jgi:hypothetical protein
METIFDLTGSANRTNDLENAARLLRFMFVGDLPARESEALTALPFLGGRSHARYTNYMLRSDGDEKLAMLDFGYGRESGRHEETVACLQAPRLAVPDFALRPERTIDRLIPMIGRGDIDFDGYPTFSHRYFLRGNDEAAVRALFTPQRLGAFEGVEPCAVAGAGRRLIYFEPDHLIWPGALDTFLVRATRIFDLLRG